jgi:hypothetical protein
MFLPLAFIKGLGWVLIAGPLPQARAACLSITAHIHQRCPELPLEDLDLRAEPAIKALEDGAVRVTVIDELHRVDQVTGSRTPWVQRPPGRSLRLVPPYRDTEE